VHRSRSRCLLHKDPGELDRFHPIGQLLEFATEAGVGINYTSAASTEHLLITAGTLDGCTVRESTIALATAYARTGRIEAAETSLAFELVGQTRPVLEGLETVLQQTPLPLPISGNLSDGSTGVFLVLEGGHGGAGTGIEVGRFLSDIGQGLTPVVTPPPYDDGSSVFLCEARID